MPATTQDAIESFIECQAPAVQPVIRPLRALVTSTLPELDEFVDAYDVIRCGRGRGMRDWVCYISGHKAHANLGFVRGSSLPDPEGPVEGTGKNLRHVKLRSVEAVERPALEHLLEAASALPAP
jgi:hypothetical protein